MALKAFTSVLIVACPCALALAAPLTHGTVQRLLARLKIFLRNALVIERMAGVDAIVLDKTGTLTTADARGVRFDGAPNCPPRSGNGLPRWRGIPRIPIRCALPRRWARPRCRCAVFRKCRAAALKAGSPATESVGRARVGGARAAAAEPPATGAPVAVAIDGQGRGAFALENSLRPEVETLDRPARRPL